MKVTVLKEEGLELALRGMAYSYKDRSVDPDEWWDKQYPRALDRAPKLARLGAGHNKFLRQIVLWVDVADPRRLRGRHAVAHYLGVLTDMV